MIEQELTDFLQYLKFEKRYSLHTQIAYQKDLALFSTTILDQYGIDDVKAISHYHIRTWLADMKDSGQTAKSINRRISTLNSFFKYLLRQQILEKNPVRMLHSLKLPQRLPSYVKEAEAERLLEEVQFDEGFKGFTDRMICELLYQTGMRRSELVQLKEQDVEWSLGQIRILGKGNKERLVPLSPMLLDTLKEYISEKKQIENCDSGHLLVLETGKHLYAGYVYRVVKQYLGSEDGTGRAITTLAKKSPHVLRHSFATHLLNNGANIQAIKDLLGHSSLASTQVYTHNNISKLKEIHKMNHPRG